MYSVFYTLCVEWGEINRSTFHERMRKIRFLNFHSLWPWLLTFWHQISSASSFHVSSTFEVSMAFRFWVNHRHTDRHTDWVRYLMRPRSEGNSCKKTRELRRTSVAKMTGDNNAKLCRLCEIFLTTGRGRLQILVNEGWILFFFIILHYVELYANFNQTS